MIDDLQSNLQLEGDEINTSKVSRVTAIIYLPSSVFPFV